MHRSCARLGVLLLAVLAGHSCASAQPNATAVLLSFKQQVQVCNPGALFDWDGATDPRTGWTGVTVTSDGAVTSINLDHAGLCGTLPASWSGLTHLITLSLQGNNLTGSLPASWGRLSALTALFLTANNLNGTLPDAWTNLQGRLQYLELSQNALQGMLPAVWASFTSLQGLDLSANRLHGSLPAAWSTLHGLQTLNLQYNSFTGSVPLSWQKLHTLLMGNDQLAPFTATEDQQVLLDFKVQNLCNKVALQDSWDAARYFSPDSWFGVQVINQAGRVQEVSLPGYGLCGSLPAAWGQLGALTQLNLVDNLFTSTLPNEWGSLTGLVGLDLHHNHFSGILPALWGNLINLSYLDLSDSSFGGSIPKTWSGLTALSYLNVANNSLEGSLSHLHTMQQLSVLNVSTNAFSGDLVTLGGMAGLSVIDLSNNRFSGQAPHGISNLQALGTLVLANNTIQGTLPSDWGDLQGLSHLDLSNNSLHGPIPASWSKLTGLTYLNLGGNKLTGSFPPRAFSGLQRLAFVDLGGNLLHGNLRGSWWTQLSGVSHLDLSNNSLTGILPAMWSRLTALTYLNLSSNGFTGTVPAAWAAQQLPADLRFNQLVPPFPNGLQNMLLAVKETSRSVCDNMVLGTWDVLVGLSLWQGVSMTGGRLSGLDLSWAGLCGTLPSSLGKFTGLQSVKLYRNNFSGTLPVAWSTLSKLTILDLSWNSLDGTLPSKWSKLSSLSRLKLNGSQLHGTLPSAWSGMQSLTQLVLESNSFTGTLPNGWARLSNLDSLSVFNNSLHGSLPIAYRALTQLTHMRFSYNYFKGTLPTEYTQLQQLRQLQCQANFLSGTVPPAYSSLQNLFFFNLANNSFTGTLPDALSALRWLRDLRLKSNRLVGAIPTAWSRLSSLKNLYLGNNSLTGTVLPLSWSQLKSSIRILDLRSNQLTGSFPAGLDSAVLIDVSDNQLTGTLPPFSTFVQYFNASYNMLHGSVPSFPVSLVYLHLRGNQLTGSIPAVNSSSAVAFMDVSSNQLQELPGRLEGPRLVYLNAGDNWLRGTLPNVSLAEKLMYCDLSNNTLTGSVPPSWSEHSWLYLALDRNRLSGKLIAGQLWLGNVTVLLLQHNNLHGCLPQQWVHNNSARILAFSSNAINCLPSDWGFTGHAGMSSFPNLLFLGLANTSVRFIPLSWMQEPAFMHPEQNGLGNHTVLQLGQAWVTSADTSRHWRKTVCIQPSLRARLTSYLDTYNLDTELLENLGRVLNQGLDVLTTTLLNLNVTEVSFTLDAVPLRLDSNVHTPSRDAICQNSNAVLIVVVQWVFVVSCIVVMGAVYYCLKRKNRFHNLLGRLQQTRLKFQQHRTHLSLSTKERLQAIVPLVLASGQGVRFGISFLMYWYDVISDLLLIRQLWGFWPGYTLLTLFVAHYLIGFGLLAWKLRLNWRGRCLFLLFGLPLMPLFDTCMFVWLVIQEFTSRELFADIVVCWQDLFEMREALEVFIEAIPTSILQSLVLLLGLKPSIGWFLDTRLYIISAVGSGTQILRLVAVVLWGALKRNDSVLQVAWHLVSLKWDQGHNSAGQNSSLNHKSSRAYNSALGTNSTPYLQLSPSAKHVPNRPGNVLVHDVCKAPCHDATFRASTHRPVYQHIGSVPQPHVWTDDIALQDATCSSCGEQQQSSRLADPVLGSTVACMLHQSGVMLDGVDGEQHADPPIGPGDVQQRVLQCLDAPSAVLVAVVDGISAEPLASAPALDLATIHSHCPQLQTTPVDNLSESRQADVGFIQAGLADL